MYGLSGISKMKKYGAEVTSMWLIENNSDNHFTNLYRNIDKYNKAFQLYNHNTWIYDQNLEKINELLDLEKVNPYTVKLPQIDMFQYLSETKKKLEVDVMSIERFRLYIATGDLNVLNMISDGDKKKLIQANSQLLDTEREFPKLKGTKCHPEKVHEMFTLRCNFHLQERWIQKKCLMNIPSHYKFSQSDFQGIEYDSIPNKLLTPCIAISSFPHAMTIPALANNGFESSKEKFKNKLQKSKYLYVLFKNKTEFNNAVNMKHALYKNKLIIEVIVNIMIKKLPIDAQNYTFKGYYLV